MPSKIAIVGMAGRFPGARNIEQFWMNLRDGVESIRDLSDVELTAAGADPQDLARPDYVKRSAVLDDVPFFDAAFFGLSPGDAAIMDPQHRHFLECVWEAFEDAGHSPQQFSGSIGVFAGSGMNAYLIHNLLTNRELLQAEGLFRLKQTGNDKDALATRVSYQFDLHGPSINVQTACSTSLVAVHLACQSLLNHECDMALAGGVTIEIPHGRGYMYREGEILSRDGHCRSFDASATGTIFGSGVGVVVLRRLEDALADRDNISAVILGSAVNNDGARKVGYLAPSVEGQAEVITEALCVAGVTAEDVSYVEAHGTGTRIGDPIELRALTQAFRKSTARSGFCKIGSVKTNIGHLDAAAGVAGLIKLVLALKHELIPASLHFKVPNPLIDLESSPFRVCAQLCEWPSAATPRRACVTSLGIGGTNAHLVLEEAPRDGLDKSERRISLPKYTFEHRRHWIDGDSSAPSSPSSPATFANPNIQLFFYRRTWKAEPLLPVAPSPGTRWLVFVDRIGLGVQIVDALRARGERVIQVLAGNAYHRTDDLVYTIRPAVRADYDLLISDLLNSYLTSLTVLHLWPVMAHETVSSLRQVLDLCFFSPLFLAQAIVSQNVATISAAFVSNHLQQVFEEPVRNPARAVVQGPARVIPLEVSGFKCRTIDIDFPDSQSFNNAERILAELDSASTHTSVAFRRGERFTESLEAVALGGSTANSCLQPGAVCLITGGLGGMGLIIAEQLARDLKAKLVLIARTALAPEAEWQHALIDNSLSASEKSTLRNLITIREISGGLMVVKGDVTNLAQMREIVAVATQRFGKIDAVFHAAGLLDDAPFLSKSPKSAENVLAPKVRGTLVLEAVLRNVPLSCFVLFSSISSIDPAAGQVDYASANAFLDAFGASRKGNLVVINWGAWQSLGMTAQKVNEHPLLRTRLRNTAQEISYSSVLSPETTWVLDEHRIATEQGSKPVFPGVAYLEMVAATLPGETPRRPIEFQNVSFVAPLIVPDGGLKRVRVRLEPDADFAGEHTPFHFSVSSLANDWLEHARGSISLASIAPARIDLHAILSRCSRHVSEFNQNSRSRQERHFVFGPRWHSLRRLSMGVNEAVAEIALDKAFQADLSMFLIHPALLDLATGAAFYLTPDYSTSEDLFLPVAYRRMVIYQPLPAVIISHIRAIGQNATASSVEAFDISIFDPDGHALVEIEGFHARRITGPAAFANEWGSSHGASHPAAATPNEPEGRQRIDPAAGARALMRILSADAPRSVIVVASPLHQVNVRPARSQPEVTAPLQPQTGPIRPETEKATIEQTLSAWFCELLGVSRVNEADDFFELGGHSLVGVRLLAKIKATYRVNLDVSTLFEAGTVSQLGKKIRAELRKTNLSERA